MPTPTYIALANLTVSSPSSTMTFSSIPATYRDLVIVVNALSSVGSGQGRIRLNSDTGGNYNWRRISGPGDSAPTSTGETGNTEGRLSVFAQSNATNRVQYNIDILDYSTTNKHKTVVNRADQPIASSAKGAEMFVTRWANTAAVTSVTISTTQGNWAVGSTFALYGVIA
jgi:hypothetical protein